MSLQDLTWHREKRCSPYVIIIIEKEREGENKTQSQSSEVDTLLPVTPCWKRMRERRRRLLFLSTRFCSMWNSIKDHSSFMDHLTIRIHECVSRRGSYCHYIGKNGECCVWGWIAICFAERQSTMRVKYQLRASRHPLIAITSHKKNCDRHPIQ